MALSGINRSFTYQGRLLTSGGSNVSDGTYSIKLSLYDASSGGTRLYTVSGTTSTPTALSVSVSSGLFSILVGDTSLGHNPLNLDWNQDSIYLGITIGSDLEMTPRKRLSAVPYAFNAETLQGNFASSSVTSTGGTLMSLHQTAMDAASATRTVLLLQTDGSSNKNDYLLRGTTTSTGDLFTVNRQGHTTTTGNLTALGISTLPSLLATHVTTTSLTWTNASSSSLTISGQSVCLANGVGCPVDPWVYNATSNFLRTTTSTLGIVLGSSATSTGAPIYFDLSGGTAGTSSLYFGYATNVNLFVGTTTYGGGLSSNFVLNGNDVFVQGMLGSMQGLFSATGVSVGVGTTVYGESNLYKTTAGDFTLSLNNLSSNWRFFTSSTERLTVASSGNIGIGVSTPLEALDVNGNVRNVLRGGQTLDIVGSVNINTSRKAFVSGKYAYVVNEDPNRTLQIIDVTNPAAPVVVGTYTQTTTGPIDVYVSGRYAYLANATSASFSIVDVSNPAAPVAAGSSTQTGANFVSVFVSGKYAYLIDTNQSLVWIFDISNPTIPTFVATTTGANGTERVYIQGNYAYTVGDGTPAGLNFSIIDISNPASSKVATSVNSLVLSQAIFVSGRYAYITEHTNHRLLIYDVSNPTSPSLTGTVSFPSGSTPESIFVSGRYAYVGRADDGVISVVDVSVPASPTILTSRTLPNTALTASAFVGAISGRYAYVTDYATAGMKLYILDVHGIETNGLIAHSAELGSLSVLTNAQVYNQFTVGGGLSVGSGGIYSQGALGIFTSSTGATSTFIFNNASNTAPVLEVRGGCDNGNNLTSLIKAGNKTNVLKFQVRCNGNVTADGTFTGGGADFAEYFQMATGTTLLPGDVVAFTTPLSPPTSSSPLKESRATRATPSIRSSTLGVVSTKPGFVGNNTSGHEGDPSYVIVGLSGQILTKVDATSDPILAGDELMAGENGIALKAHGPGMIVGRALESLPSGTGVIQVYVSPEWWAGDLLETRMDENRFLQSLVLTSSSSASFQTPRVDSPAFTFRGSAWDTSLREAVSSSFSLYTHVISPTSSLFTLTNTSGTPLLTLSNEGALSVSESLFLGGRLFFGSSVSLFADTSLSPTSTYITTNVSGFQTSSTHAYAARYESTEPLIPGDLVTVDSSGTNKVKRASSPKDLPLGIVSTSPGFVTGAYYKGTYPIALLGRVPTRVSTKKGAILPGDALMAGETPGIAEKAGGAGNTIGIALEPYAKGEEGLISVFVQPGWQSGNLTSNGSPQNTSSDPSLASSVQPQKRVAGLAKVYAGSTSVSVNFPSIQAYPLVQVTPYGTLTKGFWITEVKDTGFTIVLGTAENVDLAFAWTVEPSVYGNSIFFSDNLSLPYDLLTGTPVQQVIRPTSTTVTSTSTTSTTTQQSHSTTVLNPVSFVSSTMVVVSSTAAPTSASSSKSSSKGERKNGEN